MKRITILLFAAQMYCSVVNAQQQSDSTSMKQVELDEVVINASRMNAKLKNLPNKVEVIRAEPVFRGTATDVGQLIVQNSGVDIVQYPGKLSGIGMRGFAASTSSKYTTLLINGLPAGTENLATLDLRWSIRWRL